MYKIDRIQKIREYLLENKKAEVLVLSSMLGVTPTTIRNDFEELEQEGYVTRFHGGASLNAIGYKEDEIKNALNINTPYTDSNKEELGTIASYLIQDREWVFLGPGTTNYYIALELSKRSNIHVMSTNLLVANILGPCPSIQTVMLGGHIDSEGLYTLPEDVKKGVSGIYLSKAFFSCDGVDINAGYTLSDLNVQRIINNIIPICSETFFCMDRSKYGERTFMKLGGMDFASNVITSDSIPNEYKKYYTEHGINVYTRNSLDLAGDGSNNV